MRIFLAINSLLCLWKAAEAIQCFSCLANERSGKFCRKISEGQLINCPGDSTWCNALVFIKNGKVNVNRGCGGSVSSWGFGQSECDIMSSDALLDVGVALYQCRGDACNNIEPAESDQSSGSDVVLNTQAVGGGVRVSGSAQSQSSSNRGQLLSEDSDDGGSYGGMKPPPPRPQYPVEEEYTTKKYVAPTTQYVEIEETEETEAAYQPKPTPKYVAPTTTRKYVAPTTQYVEIEETEETEAAYQPKPTTKKYVAPTTQYVEVKEEEQEEEVYAPPKTTTTTTKRRRPDYGGEELKSEETEEKIVRPPIRRRKLFDRR